MKTIIEDITDLPLTCLNGVTVDVECDHGNVVGLAAIAEFKRYGKSLYGCVIPGHGLHCSNEVYLKDGFIRVGATSVGGTFKFVGNMFTNSDKFNCDDSTLYAIHHFETETEMELFILENVESKVELDFDGDTINTPILNNTEKEL